MFKFLSKASVSDAVSAAYMALRALEFRTLELGLEVDQKVSENAQKIIQEIEKAENRSLDEFTPEIQSRSARTIGRWVDSTVFVRGLTIEDLNKAEEVVESWAAPEDVKAASRPWGAKLVRSLMGSFEPVARNPFDLPAEQTRYAGDLRSTEGDTEGRPIRLMHDYRATRGTSDDPYFRWETDEELRKTYADMMKLLIEYKRLER